MSPFMLYALLASLMLINVQAASDGKCYALALQGGGDKAAYQAGALQGLIENLDPQQVQYDVITGVGLGAINAAILAQHPAGEESAAVSELTDVWTNLHHSDLYTNWAWGGPVRGFLFESSLYDSRPYRSFVKKHIRAPVRHFEVSATVAETGAIKAWNETTDLETLYKAIDASAAYPGFFTPVEDIDSRTYYDGSSSQSVNIAGAVSQCKRLGYAESDIVLDVILNTGATIKTKDTADYTSIPMAIRYLEIRLYFNTMDLLERSKEGYIDVNFRYVVAATKKLPTGIFPFSYDHKQILEMMKIGREDAKKVIQLGEGVSTANILKYTNEKNINGYEGDYASFLKE